jgi:hypothetical protein
MNKDSMTTILGGTIAALTAAQPVLNAASGSLHQGDYVQLAMAVLISIFGWFTNRKAVGTTL